MLKSQQTHSSEFVDLNSFFFVEKCIIYWCIWSNNLFRPVSLCRMLKFSQSSREQRSSSSQQFHGCRARMKENWNSLSSMAFWRVMGLKVEVREEKHLYKRPTTAGARARRCTKVRNALKPCLEYPRERRRDERVQRHFFHNSYLFFTRELIWSRKKWSTFPPPSHSSEYLVAFRCQAERWEIHEILSDTQKFGCGCLSRIG